MQENGILDISILTMKLKGGDPLSLSLSLRGRFQAENASLVYLAVKNVLPSLSSSALHEGFRRANLPGRMEVVNTEPLIMLDGAHTPLAIRRLLESFRALYARKGVLIFGSVAGKDARHTRGVVHIPPAPATTPAASASPPHAASPAHTVAAP